ncbi:ligase-associated DNA damage response exonuclease [Alterisphingorhabdus coralli]|uniref:Ligase-associated DNA damage response exonuclease n=1 Tax=Alterisphingorhabdus coralli TaxID=3071408 RepID=A0AA97F467_9SPHN|nr:ligase-associated DNA damage response exonuclease [Parasphingorhabdus sp. SCSIO 66989]WOE73989.1 ligase-associated DNA damage response exonuclease [Parasphingorhabdus sp. SCSIO 66989]
MSKGNTAQRIIADHWIEPHPYGIYVKPADAWIDPMRAVDTALVTHGHADHARGGHKRVFATPETLAIMNLRYATGDEGHGVPYGESFDLNGVKVSYHSAGHVLGSAQIRLEYGGETVVVTGDYKRRPDPTCAPFEVVPCDVFITEATFALPVFRHPPTQEELGKVLALLEAQPERSVLIGAYALGKAQRVIAELRALGYNKPIYLHGALEKMCNLYNSLGVDLGEIYAVADAEKADMAGHVVLAPPSALNDRWSRRLPDPITAMASGWMRIRQRARQRSVELPIILSDHADWDELTSTIREVNPREVWVTHGREDALVHWCSLHQIKARALALVGRDEADDG